MKKIYICSPYKGNVEENVKNAQQYSRCVTFIGLLPITPHIYSTQFLDDNIPEERQMGLNIGIELLSDCQEMWVFGLDKPSAGMQGEIEFAKKHNIPIYDGYEMIAEYIMLNYCKQHGIVQPSITEPILYFAGLALCEEQLKQGMAMLEIFNFVDQLKKMLGVF